MATAFPSSVQAPMVIFDCFCVDFFVWGVFEQRVSDPELPIWKCYVLKSERKRCVVIHIFSSSGKNFLQMFWTFIILFFTLMNDIALDSNGFLRILNKHFQTQRKHYQLWASALNYPNTCGTRNSNRLTVDEPKEYKYQREETEKNIPAHTSHIRTAHVSSDPEN